MLSNNINQFIAIDDLAVGIGKHDTISITIKSNTKVSFFCHYSSAKTLHMSRTTLVINIKTIRLIGHGNSGSAKFFKYLGCCVVGCSVSTVNDYLKI